MHNSTAKLFILIVLWRRHTHLENFSKEKRKHFKLTATAIVRPNFIRLIIIKTCLLCKKSSCTIAHWSTFDELQEVIFKVLCLGFKGFFSRTIHKFELLLAVMTTIHILPIDGLFLSWISIFQVSLYAAIMFTENLNFCYQVSLSKR